MKSAWYNINNVDRAVSLVDDGVSKALNASSKTRDGQKSRGEGGIEKLRRVGGLLLSLRRKESVLET